MSTLPLLPVVGVGAVIFNARGEVLLIRRGKEPASGQWSVPGGVQEAGETLLAACRREVLEETGLTVDPGPVVAVVERISEGFHYLIVDFLARAPGSESPLLRAGSDACAARWVALQELTRYDLVRGLHRIIERAAHCLEAEGLHGLVDEDGGGQDFIAQPRRSAS